MKKLIGCLLLVFIFAANIANAQTFYLQSFPAAPYPFDPYGGEEPIATLNASNQIYLVEDSADDYAALTAVNRMNRMSSRGDLRSMDFEDEDSENNLFPTFSVNYGTNLWLAITNVANQTAGLFLSNTVADVQYEIQGKANLTDTNWISYVFVLGSELTNWTPASVIATNYPNLFLRALSWQDSDGSGLPDWWQLQYFGHTGVDPYGDPDGDGWNNLQEFQNGTNPNSFDTPPAPQGLTATYNSANGTAMINWLPSPGLVTGYIVTDSDGHTFNVSASTLNLYESVTNVPSQWYNGNPTIQETFQVRAQYAGGNSGLSGDAQLEPDPLSGTLIAGPSNVLYLAISGIPSNAVTFYLKLAYTPSDAHADFSHDVVNEFSASAVTNGLFQYPSGWPLAPTPFDIYWLQVSNANGNVSVATPVNGYWFTYIGYPPPFYDGREELKQNLIFQLRAANTAAPFDFLTYYYDIFDGYYDWTYAYNPTNYVYSSFYDVNNANGIYGISSDYPALNVFRPFEDNALYRNFVYSSGNVDSGGNMTTGAQMPDGDFDNGTSIALLLPPTYQPSTNASASLLATSDTRWLGMYPMTLAWDGYYYDPAYSDYVSRLGFSFEITSTGVWTLNHNASNYWGLPFLSAKVFYSNDGSDTLNTILYPGDSLDTFYPGAVYMETAQPQLQTVEYDFWEGNQYGDPPPQPGSYEFSVTNRSDMLIVGVGGYIPNIATYQKVAVLNGYSGVYGYIGQYLDKAYKLDDNGNVTTNVTGIVSPCGSFFATDAGTVALVTMPDLDTGARGTGMVYCVSMPLDKNADGNIDLSFNGADATSANSPDSIWVNDGYILPGSNGNLDQDMPLPLNNPINANYAAGKITCQRDLENFFRLWVCGMPTLPSSQGYTVTLSCNPISGSPAINLYTAESGGGIGYLTNSTVAQGLVNHQELGFISQDFTYTFPDDFFDGSNKHFLFEGAGIGEGQFTLTISQNGNVIAQTSTYIDLHDVKDFYERAEITNVPTNFPTMVNTTNSVSFASINELPPNPNEAKQLIVFVHGWRMGIWDYEDFSGTMFKRLYWAGYQGRFASLRWPTLSASDYKYLGDLLSYTTFNRSEHIAFDSGAGTCAYLDWLRSRFPDYSIGVAAHSMGNIVMMEALKDQLAEGHSVVDNYVMMQAAVPAQCYDTSLANYSVFTAAEGSSHTPDIYRGYPGNISGAVNNQIVNFFNTNDFALATGTEPFFGNVSWEHNEVSWKPDSYWDYSSDGTSCFIDVGFLNYHTVTNPHEQMAFVARPRAKAAGALGGVGGVVKTSGQIDLTAAYHFLGNADEHSAEFNWTIQQLGGPNGFYSTLLGALFPTSP